MLFSQPVKLSEARVSVFHRSCCTARSLRGTTVGTSENAERSSGYARAEDGKMTRIKFPTTRSDQNS